MVKESTYDLKVAGSITVTAYNMDVMILHPICHVWSYIDCKDGRTLKEIENYENPILLFLSHSENEEKKLFMSLTKFALFLSKAIHSS